MKKTFMGLGIKTENIKEFENVNWEKFNQILNDLNYEAWMNFKRKNKMCLIFSYSGHGGMNSGMTEAVLNKEPGTKNSTFAIEAKLRKLAEVEGLFVIG